MSYPVHYRTRKILFWVVSLTLGVDAKEAQCRLVQGRELTSVPTDGATGYSKSRRLYDSPGTHPGPTAVTEGISQRGRRTRHFTQITILYDSSPLNPK